ncbi:uncharacterized protein ARMOST_06359 [Armillaria ostoyae]|uniref:Uncharacterized protein n=1 Tax=Armillaria ostoyae TaxID=47428 RepID=A0A284R2S0_ARMOS|nr:uncharacterized protein ARMOST_06359 [Armillaria ostoyae]
MAEQTQAEDELIGKLEGQVIHADEMVYKDDEESDEAEESDSSEDDGEDEDHDSGSEDDEKGPSSLTLLLLENPQELADHDIEADGDEEYTESSASNPKKRRIDEIETDETAEGKKPRVIS